MIRSRDEVYKLVCARACCEDEPVSPRTARNQVVAAPADQVIGAVAAIEFVGAAGPRRGLLPTVAIEPVVAVAALQRVGAAPGAVLHPITAADQYVVAPAASQPVPAPFALSVSIGILEEPRVSKKVSLTGRFRS